MEHTKSDRWFRLLHWMYFRGASLQHWFGRRIRPAGVGVLMVTSLASFMSIGQPKNSIFQIFCFSLGILLLSLVWVVFRRANVTAEIRIPEHSTVDELVRYSVNLKNHSKHKLKALGVEQSPPDPRPNADEFVNTPEPGESERNLFDRKMVYYRWQWLLSRKRGYTPEVDSRLFDLEVGESKNLSLRLTPKRRGVFPLENLRLLLPDPLGLFQKCKEIPIKSSKLVVLPKRYRLPRFELPGSAAFRIGGQETSNAIGNSGEFVGLREYRPGDSMRQIHWKSWAHTGKPMVKELEDSFYPRYGLVLDTFPGSPNSLVFEEMVSVASSFVVGLDSNDVLLDLMFIADTAHTVTTGRGVGRPEKLLEVLAGVTVEAVDHFEELASTVSTYGDQLTACVLILNGWDKKREKFVNRMQKTGISCVAIILGEGEAPEGLKGYWLNCTNVSEELFRLPTHLSKLI